MGLAKAEHGPGPWAEPMGPGPGRVRAYLDKNIFQNLYSEEPEYCIYHGILTFWYFDKKDARRKMLHFAVLWVPRSLI